MSYQWTEQWNGYRSVIKLDLPADTWIYTSECTMVKFMDLPPLAAGAFMTGDVSSCDVIVVGKGENFLSKLSDAF